MTEGGKRALFAGLLRLVPYSGVQFRDVEIPRELCDRLKTRFIEEQFDGDGMSRRILLPLEDCKPAETMPPAERQLTTRSQRPQATDRCGPVPFCPSD